MKVFVSPCLPFGYDGFTMDVRPSCTVKKIKVMIWNRSDVFPDLQDLSCHGHMYSDNMKLSDYNIQNGKSATAVFLKSPLAANADCDDAPQ